MKRCGEVSQYIHRILQLRNLPLGLNELTGNKAVYYLVGDCIFSGAGLDGEQERVNIHHDDAEAVRVKMQVFFQSSLNPNPDSGCRRCVIT